MTPPAEPQTDRATTPEGVLLSPLERPSQTLAFAAVTSESVEVLDPDAVDSLLVATGLAWQRESSELVKVRTGKDFADSLRYVNAVGVLAEAADHHPDVGIHWNQVTLRLSTHSAGGITQADLALARQIDALPSGLK